MCIKFIVKLFLLSAAVIAVVLLAACNKPDNKSEVVLSTTTTKESTSTTESETTAKVTDSEESELKGSAFDKSKIDTFVILNDENTVINGDGASFENNVLTVSGSGTFSLTGTLSEGKIYVNCNDEEKKVKLYLDGVTISCSDDAPLFIENSPKETILILAEGKVNTLSDSADRVVPDDGSEYATAAVYSKDDLQIEGSGTLNINANFNKGIFSKNDIDIRGGKINITSADDAIRGKDSVEISDGEIKITSGGDGIRTSEELEEDKGSILITGGNINITSELDGIQSVRDITVEGGTINIKTAGGAIQPESDSFGKIPGGRPGQKMQGMMFGGPPDGKPPRDSSAYENTIDTSPSAKGIKAAGKISFSGCSLTVDSADDAIHGRCVEISSGMFSIKSTDDGVHADEDVKINGGNVNVAMSYEGIEGQSITINDGDINVISSDDGFNAVSADSSSSGGFPGDMHSVDEKCQININGGYVFMNAEGDGVDSNGNVDMSDGTLIVFGPQNSGNGALDYAGSFNISGGTLLALGSAGMAQSVTGGDNVRVYAYNYSQSKDVLSAITDSNGELFIAFRCPKPYQTMVLATDKMNPDTVYTMYEGGSVTGDGKNGVYSDGQYKAGTELGVLS